MSVLCCDACIANIRSRLRRSRSSVSRMCCSSISRVASGPKIEVLVGVCSREALCAVARLAIASRLLLELLVGALLQAVDVCKEANEKQ